MKMKSITKNLIVLAALIILLGIGAGPTAIGSGVTYTPTVAQEFISSSENAPCTFTYKIEEIDGNSRGSSSIFRITGNDNVTIEPIQFKGPGYYEYSVYQVISNPEPGYIYDDEVYTISVRINSSLETEIIIKNRKGDKCDRISFTNKYEFEPTDPRLMVDPPVKKTVTGNPAQPGIFTFKLTAKEASQPMPEGSVNGVKTMQIVGSGEVEFGTWSYYEPGTYYYTISEVNSGGAGYIYDAAVYTITDMVTEMNGSLVLNRVVTNNVHTPVSALIYINKYTGDPNPQPSPTTSPQTSPQPTNTANPQNPTNPQNPQNPSGPSYPGSGPKTGDDANTTLYIVLLALGAAMAGAALALLIMGRKNPKKERRDRYG